MLTEAWEPAERGGGDRGVAPPGDPPAHRRSNYLNFRASAFLPIEVR